MAILLLEPRLEAVLKCLVDEYIRHAEPVGSKWISETSQLNVSPATIRNDMAALEDLGYIAQPHTSAGRIPTEKAYLYYLRRFVEAKPSPSAGDRFREAVEEMRGSQDAVKTLAKTLVDLSGEMAIVAVNPRLSYYTGVSNLLQKPEFRDLEMIQSITELVDRFDDVVGEMFDRVSREPQVLIGRENPFGENMSAIMVKIRLPSGHTGIIGLIGPVRMDYERNLGLMEEAKDVLDNEI